MRLGATVSAKPSVNSSDQGDRVSGVHDASNVEFEACGLGVIRWIPGTDRASTSRSIADLLDAGKPIEFHRLTALASTGNSRRMPADHETSVATVSTISSGNTAEDPPTRAAEEVTAEIGSDLSKNAVRSARSVWRLIHVADRPGLKLALSRAIRGGLEPSRVECRLRSPRGGVSTLEATIASITATGRSPRHLLIATRPLSAMASASKRHADEVSVDPRLYARLFEHLQDGLLITDDSGRVIDMNPAVTALTGYSRADLLGHIPDFTARMLSQTATPRSQIEAPRPALATWRCESVEKRRDGEPVALSLTSSSMPPAVAGESGLRAVVMSDITQARLQRDKLEWRSQFDELTGLPNRNRFMPMLHRSMKEALSDGFRLTVCMLALDDAKRLAAQFGGPRTDEILIALAGRLRKAVHRRAGTDDALARLAGDEFVLLFRSATSLEARHAVERLLQVLRQPYQLAGADATTSIEVIATASIGATVYPQDDVDADTLLRHADHALYGARQAGHDGHVFFDPDHDRRVRERLQAVAVIQDGFDADEFVLHYQPKVDMRLGRVLGVEALLRWRHPKRGLVSPGQFLPFIEHTDLGVKVGDWVLQRGIAQLADWLVLGLDITVSVNISARHLQQPRFVARLAELLSAREAGVASRLVIEVLETAALEDVGYMRKLMRDCSALGVRFALDDFGTGYSTFTYLRQLPLDLLKIDQSFVRHMLDDRQDLAIVEGVIALSRKFGCTVIAEGVESQAHAERLIEAGCDVGQGNGIAMAMPADDVEAWVHDYHQGQVPHIRLRAAEEPASAT